MLTQINGLHHITSLASGAAENNRFFTDTLGLRRIKKTVNFDRPDVYHLYYGDASGTPGTVMTYFPFPQARRGAPGTGEVSQTAFSVPPGSLPYWQDRLASHKVQGLALSSPFGDQTLTFLAPDGDGFALVEAPDARTPWAATVPVEHAIRGFHSARLCVQDTAPMAELLRLMGYEPGASDGTLTRFTRPGGNGADAVDLDHRPDMPAAKQGAGSVHHIAFSVADDAAQAQVRSALTEAGYDVTPVRDRDYFNAIYFRTPAGILFEVATDAPGFTRDEPLATLGQALKLPDQHAHLRADLEQRLEPLPD